MANTDKNIIITPSTGTANTPKIVFSGADSDLGPQNITLEATSAQSGTITMSSPDRQLFALTNNQTGTVFSVNDESGAPFIEVKENGNVRVASTSGKSMSYPRCPAFRVTNSVGGSAFAANAVATWNQLDYNNGGYFNSGNRFTAPWSGIYHFSCMILSNQSSRMYFNFRINGSEVYGTYVETYSGSNFQTGTSVMTRPLRAGDFVQVYVRSFAAYGSNYANFSGFQVG